MIDFYTANINKAHPFACHIIKITGIYLNQNNLYTIDRFINIVNKLNKLKSGHRCLNKELREGKKKIINRHYQVLI